MARNDRLYEAALAYAQAAFRAVCQPGLFPQRTPWPTWGRDADGSFRKSSHGWLLVSASDAALTGLPEYKAAEDALTADAVIAEHLGKMVGSPMSSSLLTANRVLSSLVQAGLSEPPRFEFDAPSFDALYAGMESFFYSKQVEYVALMPLAGFHSEMVGPVPFRQRTVLDRMSDSEIAAALSSGALRSLDDTIWPVGLPQPWCVRVRFDLPKKVGSAEDFQGAGINRSVRRTQELAYRSCEEVLAVLRLFKPGRVSALAYLVSSPGPFGYGGTSLRLLNPGYHFLATYELADKEAEDLRALISELCSKRVRRNIQLQNALRRFSFSGERMRPDDVLVDLMIAAECLFLPGMKEELSYRLSLNAALLLGDDAPSRRKVYDLMRAAYQMRSDIVHSGGAKPETMSSGATKTLPEFCASVEETMRQALKLAVAKAASQPPGRALFDWTGMALGQELEVAEGQE